MKSKLLKAGILAAIVALAFCMAGCSQEPIVGNWEREDGAEKMQASEDGTLIAIDNEVTTWTWKKSELTPFVTINGSRWDVYYVVNPDGTPQEACLLVNGNRLAVLSINDVNNIYDLSDSHAIESDMEVLALGFMNRA